MPWMSRWSLEELVKVARVIIRAVLRYRVNGEQ